MLPLFTAAWVAACLGGCATTGTVHSVPADDGDARYAYCVRFYDVLHRAVDEAGVRDAQTRPVPGYPYLHIDRFLASYESRLLDRGMRDTWVDRLQSLGETAWRVELTNLPTQPRRRLADLLPEGQTAQQIVHRCAADMRHVDLGRSEDIERLRHLVRVPDEYITTWRILGMYPITGLFVSFGVAKLHRDTMETFAEPFDRLPVTGRLVRYEPAGTATLTPRQVAQITSRASHNPLGIPDPTPADLDTLFEAFAPVWEVDVATGDDRIGAPAWGSDGHILVDTRRPMTYRLLSHTWWRGRPLLQLNYVIWFPARPAIGALDPYAGRPDGITLRVTLGRDGRPLFYDSMHNCGCYHMFFPRPDIGLGSGDGGLYTESVLRPQPLPPLDIGDRMVVRIAHRTHYLQRLYPERTSTDGPTYSLADYTALRVLPLPRGGHRSLFGQNGIVPESQRSERWWLWPMGVPAPGAMRQWGHHAIAFLGRRHFDDPDLLTSLFTPPVDDKTGAQR
jgi:hypothetical protein